MTEIEELEEKRKQIRELRELNELREERRKMQNELKPYDAPKPKQKPSVVSDKHIELLQKYLPIGFGGFIVIFFIVTLASRYMT